jgi:DNA helicase II / ATP-dependent DNA helicase PcrA
VTSVYYIPTHEQLHAIRSSGSAFIEACPGAGKTRTLIERAKEMAGCGTGKAVAFLSFTRAAVGELQGRLAADGLQAYLEFPNFIGTFDSFVWQFFVVPFGIDGCRLRPRLVPDLEKRSVIPFEGARGIPLSCFSRSTGEAIADLCRQEGFDISRSLRQTRAYETGARAMRARSRELAELDFDDARAVAVSRLRNTSLAEKLSSALSSRFGEVIVDEAQDCNAADLEIVAWLKAAGIATKIICDTNQSIYGFRGGVTDQLFEFASTFGPEERLRFTGNFRSTPNICSAVVALRRCESRDCVDEALGSLKCDRTEIQILSYPGAAITGAIGLFFQEIVDAEGLPRSDCPVLAKTKNSCANAVGLPVSKKSGELSLRLAVATTGFHRAVGHRGIADAISELHSVVLEIEGKLVGVTYAQYLLQNELTADKWRPRIIDLARMLRFESSVSSGAEEWLTRAREILRATSLGERSISQRLKKVDELAGALARASPVALPARTIHSVKGMEFPAVCLVVTAAVAKGVIDFLESGGVSPFDEAAREVYVAASRAKKVLAIALPRSQSGRFAKHLRAFGAEVVETALPPNTNVTSTGKGTAAKDRSAKR